MLSRRPDEANQSAYLVDVAFGRTDHRHSFRLPPRAFPENSLCLEQKRLSRPVYPREIAKATAGRTPKT